MQMGTRWAVGAAAPARLPQLVQDAVESVESELSGVDTSLMGWTLTWLEGNPVVELDDGTVIRVAGGEVFIVVPPDPSPGD